MILLDTGYLLRILVADSPESVRTLAWYQAGVHLCTSSLNWYEFLCGPVDDDGIRIVQSLLQDRVLPFTIDHAAEAARLFAATDCKQELRGIIMVATAAIKANAELATADIEAYSRFRRFGLSLAEIR